MRKITHHGIASVLGLAISTSGSTLLLVGCLDQAQDSESTSEELATGAGNTNLAPALTFRWTANFISVQQPSGTIGPEVLDIRALSKDNGAAAQLWEATGADNQIWDVHNSLVSGFYVLINRRSGKCLDMAIDTPLANGTRVQQWECTGGANQDWKAGAGSGWVTLRTRYNMGAAIDGNLCLDVSHALYTNGEPLQVWDCHGGWNQRWNIFP